MKIKKLEFRDHDVFYRRNLRRPNAGCDWLGRMSGSGEFIPGLKPNGKPLPFAAKHSEEITSAWEKRTQS